MRRTVAPSRRVFLLSSAAFAAAAVGATNIGGSRQEPGRLAVRWGKLVNASSMIVRRAFNHRLFAFVAIIIVMLPVAERL